ncbi:DUF4843 domain-containing protein [Aestuariibaculum sp. M13]|uniref:DUF4843 domain-containing protein n=1 Tax=Aestuariibaculum sp. M13 TaxID=2967132 RepID=UPI002159F2C3|nr:DUF4843 domain-containing protein [Aestuariibaculum sp. M13]MCR8669015.1 DUF4843 domain-containing protein [Aestuariibaculum sp. M13]
MKKYIYISILACSTLLSLVACAKDELQEFDTLVSNVYFEWAKEGRENYTQTLDSLDFSFVQFDQSVTDTIINVPVKILGYTSKMDRTVNIKILSDKTTAEEGVNFTMPTSVVLPADSVRAYIPVTLFRDASLREEIKSVSFKLLPNQYFGTDIYTTEEYHNVDRPLSFTEFEITFSDILTKPSYWVSIYDNYLGEWSSRKIYLLVELTGKPLDSFFSGYATPSGLFADTRILRDYLDERRAANDPVMEADGSEMRVGDNAYSI